MSSTDTPGTPDATDRTAEFYRRAGRFMRGEDRTTAPQCACYGCRTGNKCIGEGSAFWRD